MAGKPSERWVDPDDALAKAAEMAQLIIWKDRVMRRAIGWIYSQRKDSDSLESNDL